MDRLKEELITLHQLESAAHKQGFASLDEVEQAILEPGGTLCMIAKKPAPEEKRHRELLAMLGRISKELEQLKQKTP